MEKSTDERIVFLYRILNAGLLLGTLFFCPLGQLLLEEDKGVFLLCFAAAVMTLFALVHTFSGKVRVYAAIVLIVVVFYFELWILTLAVAGIYLFWIFAEKYPLIRRVSALTIGGYFLVCMFREKEVSRLAVVLWFAYMLPVMIEWVRQLRGKERRADSKAYVLWLLPFLVPCVIMLSLTPAPKEPYSWQWVIELYLRAEEKLTVWWQNMIHDGEEDFGIPTGGFSDDGHLFGELWEKNEHVMTLKGRAGLVTNVYLTGKIFDSFDGRNWISSEEAEPDRIWDTMETVYAVEEYAQSKARDYIREVPVTVKYEEFHSSYLFAPLKTSVISGINKDNTYRESGGSFLFDEQQGYGSGYGAEFYQLNLAHPGFIEFLQSDSQDDEEIWKRTIKQFDVEASNYSMEALLAYRKQVAVKYAKEITVSPQVEAWIAETTKNATNRWERLKCMEEALRSFTYTVKPGELPDIVTGESEFLTYFLTESKEGYCSYFATAFVLLARQEGLPARYVQGFCVPVSDRANTLVYSGMAHAWPEVYFEGIGWIPFEPTPGYEEIREISWEPEVYDGSKLYLDDDIIDEENVLDAEESSNPVGEATINDDEKGVGFVLPIVIAMCVLLLGITDILWEKHRDGKRNVTEKFFIEMQRNLQILRVLDCKRRDEETLVEFIRRVREVFAGEENVPVTFMVIYEECLYGNRGFTKDDVQLVTAEREELFLLLKKRKRKSYLIWRAVIYLTRAR